MYFKKKKDGGLLVEMTDEEARIFIEMFLKKINFGDSQPEIDELIASYEDPRAIPYEYLIQ